MSSPIRQLFEGSQVKKFLKGQVLFYEGESIKKMFYIEKGYVKVYNILPSGVERTIFLYGPGDAFPMTSYLSGAGVVRYYYECLSDAKLLVITPALLNVNVKNKIKAAEILIKYTSSVNVRFAQRIDLLAVNDARRKIIAMLAILVSRAGTAGQLSKLAVHLTHQDIADMCGLTRETASIQLVRLRKEGVLANTRMSIVNTAKLNKLKTELSIVI